MCETDDRCAESGARGSVPDGGQDSIDRILLALADSRCRYLLYYLDREDDAYIEDVARFIAACERSCEPAEAPVGHTERIVRDLYHVHLPKLAENGIVDYDPRSGAMCFQSPPTALSKFLELASAVELSEDEIEKF
jgi:hypothetical protein